MSYPRSQYRGINSFPVKKNGKLLYVKWEARLQIKGKRKRIGIYDTEEEAALAYDRVALSMLGQNARLNFR